MGNKAPRYRSTDGAEFQHYRFTLGMLGLNKFCTFPSWNSQTHPLRLVIGWRQGWQDLALRFLRANWRACPVASVCPGIVVDAFIDTCNSYIRRYWAKLSPARTWQHILLCSRPSPVLVLLWPVITSALHWDCAALFLQLREEHATCTNKERFGKEDASGCYVVLVVYADIPSLAHYLQLLSESNHNFYWTGIFLSLEKKPARSL